ncbi:hypothetical protein [Vulcanisaeta distributa]|uniref:Uncharacterized protein n=1 Tax=Vulcanisaeta distributa (strain DSM 14429 / JCM 11212 / NBRC 100878 / IC-017) TaxID=572478 RepID=E1QR36_VULDI|nr:hypothetical protein [Vulcanisaeta distributa]ADN51726.1 hypothetical protein Vdis_2358 [Vulcanisaeta distributa DSM 14429]
MTLVVSDDLIKRLMGVIDDRWVSIEEVEHLLGIKMNIDLINKLSRSGFFEVMYSTLDGTFYIKRRVIENSVADNARNGINDSGNGRGNKLNLQRLVDKMKSEIQGMIPKPQFEEWLSSNVSDNWRLIYNQLLNDGVIEEVIVSGMVFVKVNK